GSESINSDLIKETVQEKNADNDIPISARRAERLERIRSKNVELKDDMVAQSKDKKKKPKKHRINIKRFIIAILCVGLLATAAVGAWVLTVVGDTPSINADNIYSMLSENSVIYDDEGNELENLFYSGEGLRTNLNYAEMPEDLINAFVAIEDKTFWNHQGFNVIRIVGAIIDGITSGDSIRGTSTITQQLARNLYLVDDKSKRTLKRKVQEAYYAILLEKQLSKEQIIEAYLNTIYLGSGAYGVQAASKTYFSKDVNELTLAECAVLASIPKNPKKNSPLRTLENEDIDNPDSLDYIYRGDIYSIWYQDDFIDRQKLVLAFMKEQNKIDEERYIEAMGQNIRDSLDPDISTSPEISSYFADYVIKEVVSDLMLEYDLDESKAKDMVYNGGLRIYSTLNVAMQKIIENEYTNSKNFPTVASLNKSRDNNGNIMDSNKNIMLYEYKNMFDEDGNFTLKPDEYKMNDDGSMTIFKGNRLNIYKTEVNKKTDYSVEFKGVYTIKDGIFSTIPTGYIIIPSQYKSRDEEGNLVINKEFFNEDFPFSLTDKGMVISKGHYQLKATVIQPQSAMIITDYKTGSIKAMAGGRGLSGKQLFNRATATRQPGSAIKPMGVYGPALQRSADMAKNDSLSSGPKAWTAASIIDDAPLVLNGKLWPKNWYTGYRGLYTLRQSVEQSVNVNAVKVLNDIGTSTSVAFLKKLGVTSLVESGTNNDMNAAALALGGMTNGISPLQMVAGYGAFANQGVYIAPISYSTVTNKKGEILLQNEPKKEVVMDRGVAFIMTDILRTTVSNGIAGAASIGTHTVAGKTGTTTDNYDAWFVGMTPHYAAALWIGNDINLELSQGSAAAAKLWSKIMRQVHSGLPQGSFPKAENVVSAQIDTKSGMLPSELSALDPRGTVRSEYFVTGTVPTEIDNVHVAVDVCGSSGYLATPYCSEAESKVMVRRPSGSVLSHGGFTVGDIDYEAPSYYCNLHNPDTATYPIDPDKELKPYIPPEDEEGDGDNDNGNGENDQDGNGQTPPDESNRPEWLN
ncbi:MAG TPA: transglycosylase domain-containing protein, partial [Anaerovoracaceae bacterium]|nr:transglycosylase domain-containing protein [Anaerovoracaceae bacterium]